MQKVIHVRHGKGGRERRVPNVHVLVNACGLALHGG